MSMILFHQAARQSAPRLADFLGISAVRAQDSGRSTNQEDIVIRYGTSAVIQRRPSLRTLNRRWALNRYSNRLEQMRLLRVGGVLVPEFWQNRPEIVDGGLLGRNFREGRQTTRGQGITVYTPGQTVPSNATHNLYVELIDKERQFRVHVINGVTRTRELILNEGIDHNVPIWNFANGTYRIPTDIPNRVVPIALQAVGALRLHFGAVDIITHGSVAYVLEVNTAPGLGDPTLEWYAENFAAALGITEMPGWDEAQRTTDENQEQE